MPREPFDPLHHHVSTATTPRGHHHDIDDDKVSSKFHHHCFLVLATDGSWDFLGNHQVADLIAFYVTVAYRRLHG